MQWSNLHDFGQTWSTRVLTDSWTGTIRIAELVLKTANGESLRQQNPVRDFVAFWCLSARESLASGFDVPQLRIELRGPANSEVKVATKMTGFSRHFFYHKRSLLSGQLCPTLSVNCLADARCLGGVQSWMSDKPSQLYIHTAMTLNLGTCVSPS